MPESSPEIFWLFALIPVDPIVMPPIVAWVAVRPELVRALAPVPIESPVAESVAVFAGVPSVVTERPVDESVDPALEVPATTVPDVVRPESVSVEAPVENDSDVTPVPVMVVVPVSEDPTVRSVLTSAELKDTSVSVSIVIAPLSPTERLMLSPERKL